ncbi:hypothetical protein [Aeromonas phage 59.1]|nr:hypothetical protein [Aeromonas phage 59.1]
MPAKRPQSTAVIATSIATGEQRLYASMQEAADVGGFSYQYVIQCVRGLIKHHGGFTFMAVSGQRPLSEPTPRLKRVADLRNEGMVTKDIAKLLGLAVETVQKYQKQAARIGLTTHIKPE